jgi:hypothetical protein
MILLLCLKVKMIYETHVKLFDGENIQLLFMPYESMSPINDIQIFVI